MKFVILDHLPSEQSTKTAARTGQRHFDLVFEVDYAKTLRTYAATELPLEAETEVEIETLPDHRNMYLTYEGPISGNRGIVSRFAFGKWTGILAEEATLSFDQESKHYAGQTWQLRFDSTAGRLFRIA